MSSPGLVVGNSSNPDELMYYGFRQKKKQVSTKPNIILMEYPEYTCNEERYLKLASIFVEILKKNDVKKVWLEGYAYGATGEAELSSFAWRFTALLEPQPGAWGSDDGNFYVNPYFGLGLGYHRIQEELRMTSSWAGTYTALEDLDAFGGHAVLGIDLVLRRKFSFGCSLVSSVASTDGGWQGSTEIGGDTLFLNLDGRF